MAKLKYYASKNYPMTTPCCKGISDEAGEGEGPHGLVSGHEYSLLDVVDLKDSSGQKVETLAKIRNPWAME